MIHEIKSKLGQCKIVRSLAELTIAPTSVMSFDIETSGHNDLPGDCPYFSNHGISGLSIGNLEGDACYVVTNDSKDYGGVPISDLVDFVNKKYLLEPRVIALHYSKFDLGFLLHKGLDFSQVRLVDTWLLINIKSQGNYGANKLKEFVRKNLGLETATEETKDKWMEENKTRDFGKVPVELMAPYACDDARYTLLALLVQSQISQEDWTNHDLYLRNNIHLIRAEARGVRLDLPMLKERIQKVVGLVAEHKVKLQELIGSAEVNFDDDQAALGFLHEKSLHSKPWEKYGKLQFAFDDEFLRTVDHPLANEYRLFWKRKSFLQCFSGAMGEMNSRIWSDSEGQVGFHCQHVPSVFSQGGLPRCKQPDFTDRVKLVNEIRELFIPRNGHALVSVTAFDLPAMLLAFYIRDVELQTAVRVSENGHNSGHNSFLNVLAARLKMTNEAVSLLLRQITEGSGADVLGRRLRMIKHKGSSAKNDVYKLTDQFQAALTGYAGFKQRIDEQLKSASIIKDRLNRVLRVDAKKLWRAQSILIQSSTGSSIALYLDAFSRLADATGARLLLAHENEFLFEMPLNGGNDFFAGAKELAQRPLIDPMPVWRVEASTEYWEAQSIDSHKKALETL